MYGIVLVAIALGLSNFAASIALGIAGIDRTLRLRIVVVFGFFEAAMPLVGLLIGHRLSQSIGSISPYLGGVLLIAAGMYSIIQARSSRHNESPNKSRLGGLIVSGAALSIDNLVVGVALGAYRVSIVVAAALIATVSVAMSLLGLELGSRLGTKVEKWSAEISGAVLMIVGIAVATRVF